MGRCNEISRRFRWNCIYCDYPNGGGNKCEMCNIKKPGKGGPGRSCGKCGKIIFRSPAESCNRCGFSSYQYQPELKQDDEGQIDQEDVEMEEENNQNEKPQGRKEKNIENEENEGE